MKYINIDLVKNRKEGIEMKRVIALFLIIVVLVGCDKSETTTDLSKTPTPTLESTELPEVSIEPTFEATNEPGEMIEEDNYLEGIFEEDTEMTPTILHFYLDGTVDVSLNLCSIIEEAEGTYTKDGAVILLSFPEDTKVAFLLDEQPFEFLYEDGKITYEGEDFFSCAGIDTYTAK